MPESTCGVNYDHFAHDAGTYGAPAGGCPGTITREEAEAKYAAEDAEHANDPKYVLVVHFTEDDRYTNGDLEWFIENIEQGGGSVVSQEQVDEFPETS